VGGGGGWGGGGGGGGGGLNPPRYATDPVYNGAEQCLK